jgi:hypothetical protein
MENIKTYTDQEKQVIYSAWCKYQKSINFPIPEYSYKAYTDEVLNLWERVMKKEGYYNEA